MKKYSSVSYYDAFIFKNNAFMLVSKLDALSHDDYSHARLYTWVDDVWGHDDYPFMINSSILEQTPLREPSYLIHSLGLMSGAVEVRWPKGARKEYEFLPGASLDRGLPHLQQIKEIDRRLYVVGPDSQIFRRNLGPSDVLVNFTGAQNKKFQGRMDQWELFNHGVEPQPLSFFESKGMSKIEAVTASVGYCSLNAIDGSNENDLYAVGAEGVVVHRSAGSWRFLEKVTNAELRRVRQIDSQTVYAVGDRGTLLHGNAVQGFKVIPINIGDNLWGLEWFNGKLYIGGANSGLYVWDGRVLSKVPGLPEFDCHTLHAKDGQLLAVGSKHVYLTDDAKTWRFLQNPDNV